MVFTRRTTSRSVESSHSHPTPSVRISSDSDTPQSTLTIEEQLKQAQEKIANLQKSRNDKNKTSEIRESSIEPRIGSDSPQKGKDIKIDDIETFNNRFSIQKRHEWLINLEFAFIAAPYRYSTEKAQILGAIAFVDYATRTKWMSHLLEKTPDQKEFCSNSWEYFKEWTLTLIRNSVNFKADIRNQIEATHQLAGQHPYDFETYLYTQEEHLPRESEENRALSFFSKLLPELRLEIQKHVRPLPEIRKEMVEIAALYWNLLPSNSTSKQRPFTSKSDSPHKRFRNLK